MSRIYDNILQPVGHTPLVRLSRLEQHFGTGAEIIAKLESFNPGFSVKTRIAVGMIEEAEKRGDLKPGGTIVEGTSGNTGISLAMAAAAKGYRFIMVMPDNLSRERISIVKSFGAEVVLTPGELNMAGAGKKAAELAAAIEGAYVPGQGGNPASDHLIGFRGFRINIIKRDGARERGLQGQVLHKGPGPPAGSSADIGNSHILHTPVLIAHTARGALAVYQMDILRFRIHEHPSESLLPSALLFRRVFQHHNAQSFRINAQQVIQGIQVFPVIIREGKLPRDHLVKLFRLFQFSKING